jgi:hypothetical protein
LPDDERIALNRALGVGALPLASRGDELHTLAVLGAIAAGDVVHLCWARGDEDGAPRLRSALVDELAPGLADVPVAPRDPVPRAADARTLEELTARVALECRGDRSSRLSHPDPVAGPALLRLLATHHPQRMARLEQLVDIERRRHRFFLGVAEAHSFVGSVMEPTLLAELVAQRLPGRLSEPLSATSLESYASCPFKFFLRSVLRVRELEETDEEIDPLAFGRLHHRVLERLFRQLRDEGRLPVRADQHELDLAEEVCDDVIAEWRSTQPTGQPALFAVHERRLREQVAALLRAEAAMPPAQGCVPAHFELPFGPLPVSSPGGEEQVFLHGKIDRVDASAERAVVLDYKTGMRRTYGPQLTDEAQCVTAWQLPVYAAVARSELQLSEVEACFYSLRESAVTRAVGSFELTTLDTASRAEIRRNGGRNLGDALWGIYDSMRRGDFVVRPRQDACEHCGMEAACRVRQLRMVEDEA